MKQRLITGIVLAIVLIPLLFVANIIFYGFMAFLVLLASFEMYHMIMHEKTQSERFVLMVSLPLLTFILYGILLSVFLELLSGYMLILFAFFILVFHSIMFIFDKRYTMAEYGKMLLSTWYVAGAFAAISMVRSVGLDVLIYMLILAMLTDVFAYFAGITFGKHKLAEDISPKKTIEGAIGGTFVAVTVATIYASLSGLYLFNHLIVIIIASIFVSFIAQLGDLMASKMKREHHLKDFSKLLPGHGGILDRFDSSLFASLALMIVIVIIEVL